MNTTTKLAATALASLVAGAALVVAGPLDPPAGPIVPTYKTLTEVEPRTLINAANTPGDATSVYRITQPGSYYLGADLAGVAGKRGIAIAANRVTIDLRGFHLVGVSGSLSGIAAVAGSGNDIAITSGSVSSWGQYGIDLGTIISVNSCRLSNLTLNSNTLGGLYASTNTEVSRCIAASNGGPGFLAGSAGTFVQCETYSNTGAGFSGAFGGAYSQCTAYQNTSHGFSVSALCNLTGCIAGFNGGDGFNVNNGSTVNSCTALGNTTDGIRCTYGALIINNNCDQNGNGGGNGAGIHATGSDNRIESNNCTQADRGIEVSLGGNIIIRNTCSSSGTDWVIAANNVFGAIVDRRAPASAAVNGFNALSSMGSTDPWANFSY